MRIKQAYKYPAYIFKSFSEIFIKPTSAIIANTKLTSGHNKPLDPFFQKTAVAVPGLPHTRECLNV